MDVITMSQTPDTFTPRWILRQEDGMPKTGVSNGASQLRTVQLHPQSPPEPYHATVRKAIVEKEGVMPPGRMTGYGALVITITAIPQTALVYMAVRNAR